MDISYLDEEMLSLDCRTIVEKYLSVKERPGIQSIDCLSIETHNRL